MKTLKYILSSLLMLALLSGMLGGALAASAEAGIYRGLCIGIRLRSQRCHRQCPYQRSKHQAQCQQSFHTFHLTIPSLYFSQLNPPRHAPIRQGRRRKRNALAGSHSEITVCNRSKTTGSSSVVLHYLTKCIIARLFSIFNRFFQMHRIFGQIDAVAAVQDACRPGAFLYKNLQPLITFPTINDWRISCFGTPSFKAAQRLRAGR